MKNYEEMNLSELQEEQKNIQLGFDILKIRKSQIELEMAHKENNEEKVKALVMQSSHLLEAEHENSLEEQEWEAEQENIEKDMIQEEVSDMEMAKVLK